jgi:hypothetical protein
MSYKRITRPPIRDTMPKGIRINLGLAISGATLAPRQHRTCAEIAAYCDCSKQMIHIIEKQALRKIRRAFFGDDL